MAPKILDFRCALITGGAGGLGKAMAQWLISQGKTVVLVGRTESKLQETAKELNGSSYYVLDTSNIKAIKSFVERVTREHPEIDCLINNAGVQKPLDVNAFDLESADQEIDTNIRGPMHLAIEFLPHLKVKKEGAVIMNVSSVLGFIPFSIINPVYNGTKAWLHMWTTNLRTQLKKTNVRVVEIVPPSVGTDLHRDRENPDDNKKHHNPTSLSVEEFMDELVQGWKEDRDVISAGPGVQLTGKWYTAYGERYDDAEKEYLKAKGQGNQ
ncbi:MAG: hypothetical protein M1814_004937 [Vezdaea aestivalis]|nr:MAG: hypothetical protein M1814_004937 [Vezdaea aestivalis]